MSADDTQLAQLTRIQAQHGDWRIYQASISGWRGWVATRGDETVCADSIPQLECELAGR